MDGRKQFSDILILVVEKVIVLGLALVVSALVARTYGPSVFGTFSMALAVATMLSPFLDFGMFNVLPVWIINAEEDRNVVMSGPFVLRIISTLVILLITTLVFLIFDFSMLGCSLVLIAIFSVCLRFYTELGVLLVALGKGKAKAYFTVGACLVVASVKILAIFQSVSIVVFSAILVFESIVLSFFLLLCAIRFGGLRWAKPKLYVVFGMLRDSWPLMLAGVNSVIYLRIDQLMLGAMMPLSEVGYYAAGVRLAEGAFFLPSIVASVLFPSIISSVNSWSEHVGYIRRASLALSVLGLFVVVVGVVFTGELIDILYGSAYEPATNMARVGLLAFPFVCIGALVSRVFLLRKIQHFTLYFSIFGSVFNIILNYFFIPLWGGLGAAVSSVLSYSIVHVGLPFVWRSTRKEMLVLFGLSSRYAANKPPESADLF